MKNIWRISSTVIAVVTLIGCLGTKKLSDLDFAENYNMTGLKYYLTANFTAESDSISQIIVTIDPNDLLFTKTNDDAYKANYTIGYKVYKDYESVALDTASVNFQLNQKPTVGKLQHNIRCKAKTGANYVVKVVLFDNNRKAKTAIIKQHRKLNHNDRSFFTVHSTRTKCTINYSYFQPDSFVVKPIKNKTNYLKVLVFETQLTAAAKPFNVRYSYNFAGLPEKEFVVSLQDSVVFPPLQNGYYHFIPDTTTNYGFSVFSIDEAFPKTQSLQEASYAMGYLLDKSDYADLLKAGQSRAAFEKAWIKLSGNRENARGLINAYYREVEIANALFSNNKPGWSTDRGMIYIVYGPPRLVYRNNNSEIWVYGEENNVLSESFIFRRIKTDIADDVFELNRNLNFKVNYQRMVNFWLEERGY